MTAGNGRRKRKSAVELEAERVALAKKRKAARERAARNA